MILTAVRRGMCFDSNRRQAAVEPWYIVQEDMLIYQYINRPMSFLLVLGFDLHMSHIVSL